MSSGYTFQTLELAFVINFFSQCIRAFVQIFCRWLKCYLRIHKYLLIELPLLVLFCTVKLSSEFGKNSRGAQRHSRKKSNVRARFVSAVKIFSKKTGQETQILLPRLSSILPYTSGFTIPINVFFPSLISTIPMSFSAS